MADTESFGDVRNWTPMTDLICGLIYEVSEKLQYAST